MFGFTIQVSTKINITYCIRIIGDIVSTKFRFNEIKISDLIEAFWLHHFGIVQLLKCVKKACEICIFMSHIFQYAQGKKSGLGQRYITYSKIYG